MFASRKSRGKLADYFTISDACFQDIDYNLMARRPSIDFCRSVLEERDGQSIARSIRCQFFGGEDAEGRGSEAVDKPDEIAFFLTDGLR